MDTILWLTRSVVALSVLDICPQAWIDPVSGRYKFNPLPRNPARGCRLSSFGPSAGGQHSASILNVDAPIEHDPYTR
jgi:hypothetical protein